MRPIDKVSSAVLWSRSMRCQDDIYPLLLPHNTLCLTRGLSWRKGENVDALGAGYCVCTAGAIQFNSMNGSERDSVLSLPLLSSRVD